MSSTAGRAAVVALAVLGGAGCAAARPTSVQAGGPGHATPVAAEPAAERHTPTTAPAGPGSGAQEGSEVTLPPSPPASMTGEAAPMPELGEVPAGWKVLSEPQHAVLDDRAGVSVTLGEPGPVSGAWGRRYVTFFVYDQPPASTVDELARLVRPSVDPVAIAAGKGSISDLDADVEVPDPNGGAPRIDTAWVAVLPDGRCSQVLASGLSQDDVVALVAGAGR